jgi:hypothetical protein
MAGAEKQAQEGLSAEYDRQKQEHQYTLAQRLSKIFASTVKPFSSSHRNCT